MRTGINLAGFIFPLGEFFLRPLVVDVDLVSSVEDGFHQLRRNEIYTFLVTNHQVARHDRYAANTYGNVYAREHHVSDGGGLAVPEIGGHFDLRNAVEIAYAA